MVNLGEHFIEAEKEINKKQYQPVSYLRRVFNLEKEINKAEIHITALGLYQGYLNGKSITEQVFMPGFTFYTKRLQYQTFDVSSLVKKGVNVVSVVLGDGWYRGKIGVFSRRYQYGEKVKLALELEVHYTDGSQDTITTDEHWKATQDGPLRKSDWKEGELYDAQQELTGWHNSDYSDGNWHEIYPASYSGTIVPSDGEAILEHERFSPEVIITPDGSAVLDFKQNLFGYVEFSVTGKSGQKVKLTHGETLDEYGNFTLKNLGVFQGKSSKKQFQEVEYILKEGEQQYKPSFSAHGFRYVKLENWPESLKSENFTSIAIYSDMDQIGSFECSNALVNQLVQNSKWSQKSNFMDIPTDCPQRERAGWTGDIACYCKTASYLMNVDMFLAKWIKDLSLQQTEDGCVGSIVPAVGMPSFVDGAAGWADAAIIVPYTMYMMYGNKKILENQYASMVDWMNFLENRAKKTHIARWFKKNPYKNYTIDSGFHWGEWLEPGHVMARDAIKGFFNPDFEVATGCYGYSAQLMSEIATVLDKQKDAEKYRTLFENIKRGYKYLYTNSGLVNSERQCKYVRPIAYNLLSEEEKITNIKQLNEMVIENNFKIGTGFLTTPHILQILTDNGFAETAYGMLENKECPGWLYEVKKGATTILENWLGIDENDKPTDSFNHYLMGSVCSWLFSHVAGISPQEAGFKKVKIKPYPGGSLTHVNCSYKSSAGMIESSWKIEGEAFKLSVTVPVDSEVHMPDGQIHTISEGKHEFKCDLKKE